jgi:nitrogen fixation protein NifB
LPVAGKCDIFCRFCARGFSRHTEKPGNARGLLTPEEALGVMDAALSLCPEIRVAGVAGPGDPLSGPEALDALALIKGEYPRIIACLSTNGLNLEREMERILSVGVETITVTVNALDPEILLRINRGVLSLGGVFVGGTEGQKILIEAQERGIRLAHKNHMTIKINSVLIPGVNDGHIPHLSRIVREWGADIFNLIPLIPSGEFAGYPAPTPEEYQIVTEKAAKSLPVKMNCKRCRADACGVPGVSDYSERLYGAFSFPETFSHG